MEIYFELFDENKNRIDEVYEGTITQRSRPLA
jgi:hypothetical protein